MSTRSRGYSLIELMVAITLGLVILAGVLQVFSGSKQGYQVQQSASRYQENARFALEFLNRQLMLADLWDGAESANINLVSAASFSGTVNGTSTSCKDSWLIDPTSGIVGYAGTSAQSALADPPKTCVGANYVPYSDIVVVRHIDPENYARTSALTATTAPLSAGGYWVRSLVGSKAEVFDKSSVGSATITGDYDSGVFNYPFQTVLFYLENNDNGEGISPTLTALITQNNVLVKQPLTDGVEMMKVQYGIDSNADGSVDKYVDAGSVTTWAQVISVRLSLIVRGDALDNFNDTQAYQMTKSFCYGPSGSTCATNGTSYTTNSNTTAAQAAKYQRRLVIKEIQLRNRIRG